MQKKNYRYVIGIDTGVETGFAIYDRQAKQLVDVQTIMIHEAMDQVRDLAVLGAGVYEVMVRVEDPRQATWKRQADTQTYRAMGAGSVMRDARIWDDFLKGLGCDYEMLRPRKAMTKLGIEAFRKITGFTGRTSQHGRDAAILVYGY